MMPFNEFKILRSISFKDKAFFLVKENKMNIV